MRCVDGIVLIQDGKVKTIIYLEKHMVFRGSENPNTIIVPENSLWDIEFVNSAAKADVLVQRLIPKTGELFGSKGDDIFLELSKNNTDVDYVNKLKTKKPTVVVINFSNPWVIDEIDTGDFNTILATFGTTTDTLLDVLSGKFYPTGKMLFSMVAVLSNQSDLPGYRESEGYALFKSDEGLSY
ncbi:glycoside hydrolase family 3 C-terminal domain-containing protein [Draconibacterium sp.]|nr:glycoside hydrolase family 3 C-terminal domain-containing protein [Draconibacterium sp.]